MKTVIFEVPRIKEETIEKILDILASAIPDHKNITHFHIDKYRSKYNMTMYIICYIEDKNEKIIKLIFY